MVSIQEFFPEASRAAPIPENFSGAKEASYPALSQSEVSEGTPHVLLVPEAQEKAHPVQFLSEVNETTSHVLSMSEAQKRA